MPVNTVQIFLEVYEGNILLLSILFYILLMDFVDICSFAVYEAILVRTEVLVIQAIICHSKSL